MLEVEVRCVSQRNCCCEGIILRFIRISVCSRFNCFKETAEFCELRNNVFETQSKGLELRALFPPPTPSTSLSLHPALEGIKFSDEDSSKDVAQSLCNC
jgi:hypothetical protein